jgi:Uma2 family endonuclease
MSTTAPVTSSPPAISPHLAPRLSRLTVVQYDRMIENGTIGESDDVELIDGFLVIKERRNRPYVQAGRLGLAALQQIAPPGWHVAKEDPTVASDWSKPEPDLAIVRGEIDDYAKRDVTASDLGLVVEIAASSLAVDREVMGRLYATGGVPVYWIVSLVDGLVEVYSAPDPARGYRSRVDHRRGDLIPVALDGREIGRAAVDDLLPAAESSS